MAPDFSAQVLVDRAKKTDNAQRADERIRRGWTGVDAKNDVRCGSPGGTPSSNVSPACGAGSLRICSRISWDDSPFPTQVMARLDRLALGPERPFPHHGHQLLWWLQATYWAVVHGWSYCGETLLAERLGRAVAHGPTPTAAAGDNVPRGVRTIGVHVRRGDACERWAETTGEVQQRSGAVASRGRPCYPSHLYVAAVETLVATYPEISSVVVASDSQSAINDLVANLTRPTVSRHPLRVTFIPANRIKYDAQSFIERRRFNASNALDVTLDMAADLRLLVQECDAFVGTAASWVSRVMLLAIGGGNAVERGRLPGLPPHVFLDRPFGAVTWETDRSAWHCKSPRVVH